MIIEKVGQITTIGINRPEKRNCVDINTAAQIKEAIKGFEDDDSSCAAVLYGTGGNFCSGFDLSELANLETNSELENFFEDGFMVSLLLARFRQVIFLIFHRVFPINMRGNQWSQQ